jgi:hypothetical protein
MGIFGTHVLYQPYELPSSRVRSILFDTYYFHWTFLHCLQLIQRAATSFTHGFGVFNYYIWIYSICSRDSRPDFESFDIRFSFNCSAFLKISEWISSCWSHQATFSSAVMGRWSVTNWLRLFAGPNSNSADEYPMSRCIVVLKCIVPQGVLYFSLP